MYICTNVTTDREKEIERERERERVCERESERERERGRQTECFCLLLFDAFANVVSMLTPTKISSPCSDPVPHLRAD